MEKEKRCNGRKWRLGLWCAMESWLCGYSFRGRNGLSVSGPRLVGFGGALGRYGFVGLCG